MLFSSMHSSMHHKVSVLITGKANIIKKIYNYIIFKQLYHFQLHILVKIDSEYAMYIVHYLVKILRGYDFKNIHLIYCLWLLENNLNI